MQVINLPDMIFLDEPTTGLDSAISFEVMAAVRNLANQNRTVISTIHQPATMTFLLFDKVILLGEGLNNYHLHHLALYVLSFHLHPNITTLKVV